MVNRFLRVRPGKHCCCLRARGITDGPAVSLVNPKGLRDLAMLCVKVLLLNYQRLSLPHVRRLPSLKCPELLPCAVQVHRRFERQLSHLSSRRDSLANPIQLSLTQWANPMQQGSPRQNREISSGGDPGRDSGPSTLLAEGRGGSRPCRGPRNAHIIRRVLRACRVMGGAGAVSGELERASFKGEIREHEVLHVMQLSHQTPQTTRPAFSCRA